MGKLLIVISLRDRSGRCMYEEHNLAVSNLCQHGVADQMVIVDLNNILLVSRNTALHFEFELHGFGDV